MEILIHPKTQKVTIEIPKEYIDKDLEIVVKPKSNLAGLAGSLKVPKEMIDYELEKKAWEMAVREKYAKN